MALAFNPRRRRSYRRSYRRHYPRRRNPSIAGIVSQVRRIDLADIGMTAGGFVGNLLALQIMPTWFRDPMKKYIVLGGLPVAARMLLKGRVGERLFLGGMVALGAHIVNDWILRGQILPESIAYRSPTTVSIGQSYLEPGATAGLAQATPEVQELEFIGQTEDEADEEAAIEAALGAEEDSLSIF